LVGEDHDPNLCRSIKKCSLPSAFVKIYASWYCVGTDEWLIIPTYNFSRTTWQSISMCFVHSWNTGFTTICNAAWLSQKIWVDKLHDTFKYYIATKLSPNKYCPSRGILLSQWSWYVCLFFFLLPWDNRRTKKNAIPSEFFDNLPVWAAISYQMSDCSWMAIAILVPVILWCTLGLKLRHPDEVFVESVYIDLGSEPKILYQAE